MNEEPINSMDMMIKIKVTLEAAASLIQGTTQVTDEQYKHVQLYIDSVEWAFKQCLFTKSLMDAKRLFSYVTNICY